MGMPPNASYTRWRGAGWPTNLLGVVRDRLMRDRLLPMYPTNGLEHGGSRFTG